MDKFLFNYSYYISIISGEKMMILASIIIFFIILFWHKERKLAEFVLSNYIVTMLIVLILKYIIHKPRNTFALVYEYTYAYPSGHVAAATITFLLLFFISKKFIKNIFWKNFANIFAIFWLISIIFARLYLKVHDIYDVLGAMILSIFIFNIIKNIKYFKKIKI